MAIKIEAATRLTAAANAPERFRTGVKNQTVPNPGAEEGAIHSGPVTKYDFGPQSKNFKMLQAYLKKIGKPLTYVGVASNIGPADYVKRIDKPDATAKLVSFVAVDNVKNPTVVWQKYEGKTAGGGKNMITIDGVSHKLSDLLGYMILEDRYSDLVAAVAKAVKSGSSKLDVSLMKAGPKWQYSLFTNVGKFPKDIAAMCKKIPEAKAESNEYAEGFRISFGI